MLPIFIFNLTFRGCILQCLSLTHPTCIYTHFEFCVGWLYDTQVRIVRRSYGTPARPAVRRLLTRGPEKPVVNGAICIYASANYLNSEPPSPDNV